ncbi:MAG TPA: DUF3043 domain-containing protein [Jiangellaceae bacterium]
MRSSSSDSTQARQADSSAETGDRPTGKGKATPKRREAEAARKARVKPALTRRERFKRDREQMKASRQRSRQGLERGDERYLMKRDKGPVRKFVRDFVDSRRLFSEFFLPVILLILLLGFIRPLAPLSSMLMMATVFLVIFDLVTLRFRLKRQIRERFPDDDGRHTLYAFSRATQLRRLRIPKPTVKPGDLV